MPRNFTVSRSCASTAVQKAHDVCGSPPERGSDAMLMTFGAFLRSRDPVAEFRRERPGGLPLAAVDTEAEVRSALVQSRRNRRDRLKLVRNLRERDRVDPR
jgi:hypothetical protein